MLSYLYGHDALVAQFVAQLVPHCHRGFPPEARGIGVLNESGVLIGGLVYHNYDDDSGLIELTGAAIDPHWLMRGTIERMYRYPFITCGCQMLVQRTPIENERLLRQLAVYDYTFIKVPRMFGRGKDGVLCLLTAEDWANNRFNKRFKHHLTPETALADALEEAA
jgi:hypothetical protein